VLKSQSIIETDEVGVVIDDNMRRNAFAMDV